MIELRRYIAGDALLVDLRQELAAERAGQEAFGHRAPPGRAWTLTRKGFVVGCGGIAPEAYGRGYVWTMLGALDATAGLAVARACRRAVGEDGLNYRRLEAHTRCGFDPGVKFLHWLGFEIEGRLRAWGPDGSDYFLFARVT